MDEAGAFGDPVDRSRLHFDGSQVTDVLYGRADWVRIWDGGLSQPVEVRFRIDAGGHVRLHGLRWDNGRPVTARLIREPRVTLIEDTLTRYIREEVEDVRTILRRNEEQLARHPEHASLPEGHPDRRKYDAALTLSREWVEELEQKIADLQDVDSSDFQTRGPGAAPPGAEEYRKFAKVYLDLLTTHPHNYVSRVAEQFGMHRTTVYRWAKECRERGLIPKQEK